METQSENPGNKSKIGPVIKNTQELDLKHNVSCQCYEETLKIDGQEVGHTIGFFGVCQYFYIIFITVFNKFLI